MKKTILILFCILTANIAFTQWKWQHPVPQGNSLNDIFFINQETGWAIGNLGTIIKSEDGGLSYEVIYYPTYSNLSAVEFFDLYTGFVVGDSTTILKTIDGGSTWESIELGLNENYTDISLTSPEKVWITGDNGTLLYSEDMGESWETQFSDTAFILNSVCFIDEFHGWIAARNSDSEDILLYSEDGGISWLQIYSSNTYHWCVHFFNTLNGYGYDQGTIKQTTDGGTTWEVKFSTVGFYSTYIKGVVFSDPEYAWITTSSYMSPDGIIFTHNGFESWDWANFEGNDSQLLYCAFFTDNVNGWAAGSGGNLAKTTDGGINWVMINSSTDNAWLHDVFFTDSTNGWAVGGGQSPSTPCFSHLLHTDDGGSSWETQELPPNELTSVFFIDSLEGWIGGLCIGGDTIDIFHTNNGGASWEKQSVFFASGTNAVKDIWFTDSQHGWVVGGKFNHSSPPGPPLLLNTVNGGETWEDQSILTDKSLSAVCFSGQNNGWMAGNEVILHTTDGGQNWEEQVTHFSLRDIFFIDNDNGWAVGDSMSGNWQIEDKGIVMRTTDGGGTWDVTSFDQWFRFYKVFFTDLSHGWIVGQNDLLYTNDGGNTWNPQFVQQSLKSIFFTNQDKGWVVGYGCSILHTNSGGIMGVKEESLSDNGSTINVKNYPNPFSNKTTIEYTLEDPCMVILRIFNSFGQMVDEPVKEFQFRGEQKVIWNAEGMPTGMYYYSITASNSSGCGKLVVK